jgi:hypothetical protein
LPRNHRLKILDETGIPGDKPVSSERPSWSRTGGVEMAREWLREQFGVTFAEDVRPVTVYVVRPIAG